MAHKDRNQDRRSGDRLVSLTRLCDFFIEEKKKNPHSEYAWNELRDEIFNLRKELESMRSLNANFVQEINLLKDEITDIRNPKNKLPDC
jgi:hypothetical protein